jgi:hypothetical protein
MELLGRRWDRWDGIVAAAAVTLIVVSYQPWWSLHGEPDSIQAGAGPMDYVWSAWSGWQWWNPVAHWWGAVALGTLAAGVHLASRGRRGANVAALLAALMLLVGLGLAGWQWHRASGLELKGLTRILTVGQRPNETDQDYRHRHDEEVDAAIARTPSIPTRSAPRSGVYAGVGSLIVMLAAIARGLVPPRLKRASES